MKNVVVNFQLIVSEDTKWDTRCVNEDEYPNFVYFLNILFTCMMMGM